MKKTALALIALYLFFPFRAFAVEPPKPGMFAYGMKIMINGRAPVYKFPLPLEVYQGLSRADRGDMRVFNGKGESVPFLLRRPLEPKPEKDRLDTALPFFPVMAAPGEDVAVSGLHIETGRDGMVINVSSAASGDGVARVAYWLIDCTAIDHRAIFALDLSWPMEQGEFIRRVRLETSDDLQGWRRVTTATIARMRHRGFRLDRNRIRLDGIRGKYLRLVPVDRDRFFQLSAVIAHGWERRGGRWPDSRHLQVETVASVHAKAGFRDYLADVTGFIPLDSVRVSIGDENAMATVALLSANSRELSSFSPRWRGIAYSLAADGVRLKNDPVSVGGTVQRYWLVRVAAAEGGITTPPLLDITWRPEDLVFLARGNGPFILAYGATAVLPPGFHLGSLLAGAQRSTGEKFVPRPASTGAQYLIGGRQLLIPADPPVHWRRYTLWLVLISGVLLIALMAWSIYRQMNREDESGES